MVQQTVDSKFGEYRLGDGGANLPTHDTQFPIAAKKTALRDVQNEIRSPNSIGNPKLSKDRGTNTDVFMASGAKRPLTEGPVHSSHYQPPFSNSANAHLVYVRRKPEAEISKSNAADSRMINSDCSNSRQRGQQASQSQQQIKEPKLPSLLAFPSLAVTSSVSTSGKPSVSFSPGQSNPRFSSLESNKHPVASSVPLENNLNGMRKLHWEERYCQLQSLLKQLDESDQEEYIQMLRSLSSVELSRHAVELEKRSIQLSLEEVKELQRVGVLNVLGNPQRISKQPEHIAMLQRNSFSFAATSGFRI